MARPQFEITPAILKKVEKLASRGLTNEQIAVSIGCGVSTLQQKKKVFKEFSEAIKRGKAKGISDISNKLFNKALKGDTTAIIYYLSNRDHDNWRRTDKKELEQVHGDVAEAINNLADKLPD